MDKDKLKELHRYDQRALSYLTSTGFVSESGKFGCSAICQYYLRSPYVIYEKSIRKLIRASAEVLEIGAGIGLHTWVLSQTGAKVTAIDISPNSLKLLEKRIVIAGGGKVHTSVADMESLPFADDSFDVVACAGCLSYGAPELVDAEIRRVLRPDGLLICVDSLNHNPIYRLNRWLQYLRGFRTKSTLQNMPNLDRVRSLSNGFTSTEVHYFGSLSFAMPLVGWLFGQERAQSFSDYVDKLIDIKGSAFKFVLVAKGFTK